MWKNMVPEFSGYIAQTCSQTLPDSVTERESCPQLDPNTFEFYFLVTKQKVLKKFLDNNFTFFSLKVCKVEFESCKLAS